MSVLDTSVKTTRTRNDARNVRTPCARRLNTYPLKWKSDARTYLIVSWKEGGG